MKLGFVSDAHGNPRGLTICLDLLASEVVDEIFFLGDAVGYFPLAGDVLALLIKDRIPCICGNHEAMLLGRLSLDSEQEDVYRLTAAAERLSAEHRRWMAAWPPVRSISRGGRRLLLTHGSPFEHLTGYVYPDSDLSSFGELKEDAVFIGHTHRPFISRAGKVTVVNVGSCGLPRGPGARACAAVYDTETGEAKLIRAPLPVETLLKEHHNLIHPAVKKVLIG